MPSKPSKKKSSGNKPSGSHLMEFYGTECHFCIQMAPMVERLEQDEGVKVEKIEVWHNAKNAELLQQIDKGKCGGVPFFYNKKTGKWICGFAEYESLKQWALGK